MNYYKKAKPIEKDVETFSYLEWIPDTSNCAERLFSQAGFFKDDHRFSLLPGTSESFLFLNMNADLLMHILLIILSTDYVFSLLLPPSI